MPANTYLAFDFGAESGRALAGSLADDHLEIRELHRFANGMLTVHGHQYWNLFRLFEQVIESLRRCATAGIAPTSIGVDTWGVDFGLVAADGSLLGMPVAYRDRRTEGAMDSFFAKMPREEVYRRTGIQFLQLNSLFQLEAMVRDRAPQLDAASDLLFIPDLFHYLLTGEKKSEFTFATTTQLFNPRTMSWDEEILAALPVERSLLAEVVEPGARIGMLTEELCRATGLSPTPVVAVATHDTGSAVAAVPAVGDGWAYLSSGTWSLMGIEAPEPIISEQALAYNLTNEGGVNRTFRVLKNIMGLWLVQQCRRVWNDFSYAQLTALAGEAEPFVALVDPDDPSLLNPPDMPAAVRAYCRRTGQREPDDPGAITRCLLESLALKYRLVLEQLRAVAPGPIERLHVIGGGTQNELLCQLTADACGIPVEAGPIEATAIGNLLVQAMAAGQVESLAHLRRIVRNSFPVIRHEPRGDTGWDDARRRFQELNPI